MAEAERDPSGPGRPTRTAGGRRRSVSWRLLVPVVLAVVGLLLATSARTHPGRSVTDTNQDRLVDLVAQRQQQVDAALAQQRSLEAQVQALTSEQAGADARVQAQESVQAGLVGTAGLQAATGPAYEVSLDDAPRGAPVAKGYPAPTADDLVVHQQDVQAVVNALWAGGAEAMTIMGQRVISTSAVRCVGNTLLLQGRVYSPPFVVVAIGGPNALAASVAQAPAVQIYQEYVKAYGLRFSARTLSSTTLPAYDGPLDLTHAVPLPDPSPSPTATDDPKGP